MFWKSRRRTLPVYYDVYFFVSSEEKGRKMRSEMYPFSGRKLGRADKNMTKDEFRALLRDITSNMKLSLKGADVHIHPSKRVNGTFVRSCHVHLPEGVKLPKGIAAETATEHAIAA